MSKNLIIIAADIVGSQAELARVIGVSGPTVNQWASGHRPVPAERCPQIEKATGGVVRCEMLRPDVDWAYLRGTDCPRTKEAA